MTVYVDAVISLLKSRILAEEVTACWFLVLYICKS